MDRPPADDRLGRASAAPGVTAFYDRGRCRHYAECVRGLPHVFDPTRRPETRAALCACGRTQNQPFCDGACGVNAGPSGGTRYEAETSPRHRPDIAPRNVNG